MAVWNAAKVALLAKAACIALRNEPRLYSSASLAGSDGPLVTVRLPCVTDTGAGSFELVGVIVTLWDIDEGLNEAGSLAEPDKVVKLM
jgi:hypothetical protein